MNRQSRNRNRPIDPTYIDQSHFVAWYIPHDDGRKSRCSEVGMMTKRSSHMPTLTNMAVTNSITGEVRKRLTHMSCGASPLQTMSMAYIFQYGPWMRLRNMYRSYALPL